LKPFLPNSLAAQGLTVPPRRHEAIIRRDPSDASIGTGNFTQGVPAFWFARATEYGFAENLYSPYADSVWVQRAIKIISQPIASCEVQFSKPTAAKTRQASQRLKRLSTARGLVYRAQEELIDLPQVRALLNEPVRELTYFDFVEASIGWLKLQECFWILANDSRVPFPDVAANPFGQLKIARPGRMRPTIEDDEIIEWTYTTAGGKTQSLDPSEVIRLRNWNPYNDHRGLGEYRATHIAAEADWLAGKFSRNLMANNGDTSRIIAVKGGQPTDEQREQLIMQFKERRNASLRGESKDVVVGGDVELHNAELASVDESFIGQRLENRHEIFIGLGVPPSMADIKASYSIGSASDMFQLLINTCIPTGAKFCGALEKLIFRLTGDRVEVGLNWDEHPSMQQVRQERLDSMTKLAAQGMPMEKINEYLLLGLPEYPEWQQGYIAISLTPVSAAANEAAQEVPEPGTEDFSESSSSSSSNGKEPDDEVKAMFDALEHRHGAGCVHRSSKNKTLWEAHMRLRAKSVKLYQSKCSKVFNEFRAKALHKLGAAKQKAIETRTSILDLIFDPKDFGTTLHKNLDPVTRAVLQTAGTELLEEIGRKDDPWTMPSKDALRFIGSREKWIKGVGDTARDQLNTAIQESEKKGEGIDEMTARIRGVFNNLSKYEARRIAMTETSAAYGFSRHKAMTDVGVKYKTWLSSHGPTVRPAHAKAEDDYGPGNGIPVDEPFVVDGEELMHPGDESGSAGNVINCQCIELAEAPPKEGGEE
jgi:phage portal protein BeeE